MKYNIEKRPGPYQTFSVKLENNIVTFFDYGGYEDRNISTIRLIENAIKNNENLFLNKTFDIEINTSDQINERALSYSHPTNKYFTIPCFTFDGWRQIGIDGFENMVAKIKEKANEPIKYNKLFWSGSIGPHIPPRVMYDLLSKNHTDLLLCNSIEFVRQNPEKLTANNFVSLPEHCDFKYLLDIEGVGWSARLKFLCFTKRVLFINDRPYKEFWMDGLIDGENCIIVNRDLSNLIEKIEMVEANPELYSKLANNLYDFANSKLTIENVNKHIIDVLLKKCK